MKKHKSFGPSTKQILRWNNSIHAKGTRAAEKWWNKQKFTGPTFFECYVQGYMAGRKSMIKVKQ